MDCVVPDYEDGGDRAKRVEAQSVPVVRDSSIRNPLAFEEAWRAALTLSDGFADGFAQWMYVL